MKIFDPHSSKIVPYYKKGPPNFLYQLTILLKFLLILIHLINLILKHL
jgi:hypothetical protein